MHLKPVTQLSLIRFNNIFQYHDSLVQYSDTVMIVVKFHYQHCHDIQL